MLKQACAVYLAAARPMTSSSLILDLVSLVHSSGQEA